MQRVILPFHLFNCPVACLENILFRNVYYIDYRKKMTHIGNDPWTNFHNHVMNMILQSAQIWQMLYTNQRQENCTTTCITVKIHLPGKHSL